VNRDEAIEALQKEVVRLRGRTHAELVAFIDTPLHVEHKSNSGRIYQVEVGALWDDQPGQVLRLSFAVDDRGLRAYFPLVKAALISPGGVFDGDVE